MNRELYRLIKALRRLSADDVARVQAFINQLRAANLRGVPAELKAVPSALAEAQANATGIVGYEQSIVDVGASRPDASEPTASEPAAPLSTEPPPLALWHRRAFQDIPEADLRPIAVLVREARENRAVARQRFGGA